MAPNTGIIIMLSIPLMIAKKIASKKNIPHFFHAVFICLLQVVWINTVLIMSAINLAKKKLIIYITSVNIPTGIPITVIQRRITSIGVTIKYISHVIKLFPGWSDNVVATFSKFL